MPARTGCDRLDTPENPVDQLPARGAMRVLILSASPLASQSVTFHLAERLAGSLFPQAEREVIHLHEVKLPACDGQLDVIKEGENLTGAMSGLGAVYSAMRRADVVVFASPVHNFTVSALLKNFIDLMVFESHRPSFIGKPAVLVATAMGAGQDRLFAYLRDVVHSWGFRVVGCLGAAASMLDEPWYEARLQGAIGQLAGRVATRIADQRPRVGLRDVVAFNIWRLVVEINRENTPIDHEYWSRRGWLSAHYYYPCRTWPPARWIARLIATAVRHQIIGRKLKPVT